MDDKPKSNRGFASMNPEKQREIARLGGRAAHASGRAHQFSSEEARAASLNRRSLRPASDRDASADGKAS